MNSQQKVYGEFMDFVKKFLLVPDTKCYRHCEETAKYVPVEESEKSVIGAYVCPGKYVSRVIYFADQPDPKRFEKFLRDQVGEDRLKTRDIRVATRHGWELGNDAENKIADEAPLTRSIKQYYWVFYPQTDEEKKVGTFICPPAEGGCNRMFSKLNSEIDSVLCPDCEAKRT